MRSAGGQYKYWDWCHSQSSAQSIQSSAITFGEINWIEPRRGLIKGGGIYCEFCRVFFPIYNTNGVGSELPGPGRVSPGARRGRARAREGRGSFMAAFLSIVFSERTGLVETEGTVPSWALNRDKVSKILWLLWTLSNENDWKCNLSPIIWFWCKLKRGFCT